MLIDTTLREGAQLFGAYYTLETRVEIVRRLIDLGVEELELGWTGQDEIEKLVDIVFPMAGQTFLSVWSPCREDCIQKAARYGVHRVNIGVPVSDLHMGERLGLNRSGLLERLAASVKSALDRGIEYVSVGFEDVSRADTDFASTAATVAQAAGASRIRLSDSLGLLTPVDTMRLVSVFKSLLDIDVAVHCHNDFGMATANAVTALQAGADFADTSVLGIGERSGIAATEEVAAHLALKDKTHGYDTMGIRSLCNLVAKAANIPVSRIKSIAGEDIFSCESGLHVHAMSKSPDLFEPYAPEKIGVGRKTAVGGKSGRGAVAHALRKKGISFHENNIDDLVRAVRKFSLSRMRPLTDNELMELVNSEL